LEHPKKRTTTVKAHSDSVIKPQDGVHYSETGGQFPVNSSKKALPIWMKCITKLAAIIQIGEQYGSNELQLATNDAYTEAVAAWRNSRASCG
jgi:hypothetical protein